MDSSKPKKKNKEELSAFYDALVSLDSRPLAKDFLDDLLSDKEKEDIAERVYIAKLFLEGKTYNEIVHITHASSATLARISKCVKNGKGYRKVLSKTAQNTPSSED
ncbi:MAG: YerC/YecD family TrpR-related protein [Eubacteriales bacterium]|nr:YerC/YecD family TrpR-related protein [Eubacteriales bacterium]